MPWDPVRDLLTMQERLESLFGQANPGWVPPVDLVEYDDHYVLTFELPGLSRTDVTISGDHQTLTVRGSRPAPTPASPRCPERFQQLERGQGQFSRVFRFSVAVASERIVADLLDGVLTITVPKATVARHHIQVS
jgi:HSP20 family protein